MKFLPMTRLARRKLEPGRVLAIPASSVTHLALPGTKRMKLAGCNMHKPGTTTPHAAGLQHKTLQGIRLTGMHTAGRIRLGLKTHGGCIEYARPIKLYVHMKILPHMLCQIFVNAHPGGFQHRLRGLKERYSHTYPVVLAFFGQITRTMQ